MNQNLDRLTLSGLLLVVTAACGYDSSAPYNPPASVDGLWTSSAVDPAILRFDPSQLAVGGRLAPSTRISAASADLLDLNGLAFDSDGTMWVASSDDSLLIALAPQSLGVSGGAIATTVISSNDRSLSRPVAIAFDKHHRMWVANFANQTIVRFEHSQLATSGAAVPTLTINTGVNPSSLAFDAAGNLWVASIQANKIFSYNAVQQESENVAEPEIVISTNGTALQHPSGLAFDAAGNLWVASLTQARIDAFNPAQLAVSGSPDPAVSITSNDNSIDEPVALAFDGDGSLWVMGGASGQLSKFSRAALAQSSSQPPALTLTPAGYTLFWNIAFWPKPAGLPLN
jgi:sugar lactone lactonase YvrE